MLKSNILNINKLQAILCIVYVLFDSAAELKLLVLRRCNATAAFCEGRNKVDAQRASLITLHEV